MTTANAGAFRELLVTERERERFWGKVDISGDGDCWTWTGCTSASGRGRFGLGGKSVFAHRVALASFLERELIPGLLACHRCNNGHLGCVNPQHLYEGTMKQNMADMVAAGTSTKGRSYNAGERHGMAKVTDAQAREIFTRRKAGERVRALAAEFNVSEATISLIGRGRTHKHATLA